MKELTIVWLPKAKKQLFHILAFWIEKNKSATYSLKIEEEIRKMTNHLSVNPKIGQKVEYREEVRRIIILRHFSIFYKIIEEFEEIRIIAFWDNRNDPNKLKI
ncbi:MAG: type II toxin-antitoxin system RelE/ParE family toxin [Capnocytophaga sp.]|nr:type II toxin-antitoxin system RelE/ParE family toxin [Capnocytophaga sp.]